MFQQGGIDRYIILMELFASDRLRVRTLQPDDRDFYLQLFGDAEVVRYIRQPLTIDTIDAFLSEHLQQNQKLFPQGRFIVESKITPIAIGTFVIIPIDGHEDFQIGYAFIPETWGKGLATELVQAGLHYAIQQCKLCKVYALTEVPNTSSQRVLVKTGFRYVNTREKDGIDLQWYVWDESSYSPSMNS